MTATMTGASTNFGNGEGQNGVEEPNIPPPPKRSIFMSQAEYRRVQEEYEYEVEQAKRAAQMRSQAAVFNPNGQIGGTQVTIKDAQGNPVTVSEGSVVYLDVNGNFSTTPFSNQPMVMNGSNVANGGIPMNASPEGTSGEGYLQDSGMGNNFGPLTFPDQNFDFQNAAQTTPIQGNMIDPLTNPAATSNNYGPQFQNSSLSSGSPYTQVEERLGGESYLPSPQQTPVDASSLPPRPETQSN